MQIHRDRHTALWGVNTIKAHLTCIIIPHRRPRKASMLSPFAPGYYSHSSFLVGTTVDPVPSVYCALSATVIGSSATDRCKERLGGRSMRCPKSLFWLLSITQVRLPYPIASKTRAKRTRVNYYLCQERGFWIFLDFVLKTFCGIFCHDLRFHPKSDVTHVTRKF